MKRIICIIMVSILLVNISPEIYVAENSTESMILNMEQYFAIETDGTISFDSENAKNDGISIEIIEAVSYNISIMNENVKMGYGHIQEDFSYVEYYRTSRAARGVNKVVIHWYGLTELYMDSDKADALYDRLVLIGEGTSGSGIYDFVVKEDMYANAGAALGQILVASTAYLWAWQVEMAKAGGTGIIINHQRDLVYGTESIWVTGQ